MFFGLPFWVWLVIIGMITYNCYITTSIASEHFDENKSKPKIMLCKADWCGHCKKFKPEWDIISNDEKLNTKVDFIIYDSEKDKEQIEKYKIQGFPTILIEKAGKISSYEGPRTAEALKRVIEEL